MAQPPVTVQLPTVFKLLDRDCDGKLNLLEVHQGLGICGACPAIIDVQDAMNKQGIDKIDLAQFTQWVQLFQATVVTEKELAPLFNVVDPQSKGSVDTYALEYLLQNFNERLSRLEAKEFSQAAGCPEGGSIAIAELVKRLTQMQKE